MRDMYKFKKIRHMVLGYLEDVKKNKIKVYPTKLFDNKLT